MNIILNRDEVSAFNNVHSLNWMLSSLVEAVTRADERERKKERERVGGGGGGGGGCQGETLNQYYYHARQIKRELGQPKGKPKGDNGQKRPTYTPTSCDLGLR